MLTIRLLASRIIQVLSRAASSGLPQTRILLTNQAAYRNFGLFS
jgi:hypothetical protein